MNGLLTTLLLIVTVPSAAPIEDRYPGAVEVYRCDFDQAADANYDGWPDHWTRRRGPGFPQYLNIALEPDEQGGGWLRIDLDGGAAVVTSPPIEVSPQFAYVLQGALKTEQLQHHVAYYALTFYDAQYQALQTIRSRPSRSASEWEPVQLGPLAPSDPKTRLATVSLHLRPTEQADLVGAALFHHVWLGRLPHIALNANHPHQLYSDPDQVQVTCRLSGSGQTDSELTFELLDVHGGRLATANRPLQSQATAITPLGRDVLPDSAVPLHLPGQVFSARATWNVPIPRDGFYRVRASVSGPNQLLLEQTTTLAVTRLQPEAQQSRFGWSLGPGEYPPALAGLLGQVGIGWVKFPVVFDKPDVERTAELVRFAEQLQSQGIRPAGVLLKSKSSSRSTVGPGRLPAAAVFVDPQLWQPLADPAFDDLALRIRWWQLGTDQDMSFSGTDDLDTRLQPLKQRLRGLGKPVYLGAAWPLQHPPSASLDFVSLAADPEPPHEPGLPPAETSSHAGPGCRWVTLAPPGDPDRPWEERAGRLVAQMLAASRQGADAVFFPNPLRADGGLVQDDGTPGELLLPWRTMALMLSGSRYLGTLQLPAASPNQVFARGDQVIVVLWNERPVTETLYLGQDVDQVNLWGHGQRVPLQQHQDGRVGQAVAVGRLPTLLTGAHPSVLRWRMACRIEPDQLASLPGRQQELTLHFQNPFEQAVSGELLVQAPEAWNLSPLRFSFDLEPGQRWQQRLAVQLSDNAHSGPQPVQLDFQIDADRQYRFRLQRSVQVGLDDVLLEADARIDQRGNLVVQQHLINKTDQPLRFHCWLFAPDRTRHRATVHPAAHGRDTATYVLPKAKSLAGQSLWLRAEELDGGRILNQRLRVQAGGG